MKKPKAKKPEVVVSDVTARWNEGVYPNENAGSFSNKESGSFEAQKC